MKRSLLFFASAAGLLGLACMQARASQISAQWSYVATPSTGSVLNKNIQYVPASGNPNAGVQIIGMSGTSLTGNSFATMVNLLPFSNSLSGSDTFSVNNGAYSIGIALSAKENGQLLSKSLTISGTLNGQFSIFNSSGASTLNNTFTGPTAQGTTFKLGNLDFNVSAPIYYPPGGVLGDNGKIGVYVSVSPDAGGGNGGGNGGGGGGGGDGNGHGAGGTPEPSTLVLSCLGLTLAGAASWRKRRRTLAALLA